MASQVPSATAYAVIYATTFLVFALPVFYFFFSKARKNRAREDIREKVFGMFKLGRSLKTERMLASILIMAEFMQLTALSFVGSIPWFVPGWISSIILFKLGSAAEERMNSWIDAHTLFMVLWWGMVALWLPIVLVHTSTQLHRTIMGEKAALAKDSCFRPVHYVWFLIKSYAFVFLLECHLMPATDVFLSALACTYENPESPRLIVDPENFKCFVGKHLMYIVISVLITAYMFVVALRHALGNHLESQDFYYLPRFDVARVGLDFSLAAALAFVSDEQPWAYLSFITMISVVLLSMNYTMQPCIGSELNYSFNHARTATFCAVLWSNCMAFVVMVVDDDTKLWPLIVYLVGVLPVMVAGYKLNIRRSNAIKSTLVGAVTGGGGAKSPWFGGSQKSTKSPIWGSTRS